MTQVQWDKHIGHFNDHITWPASKEEIIKACSGEDVEPEILEELTNKLTAKPYNNSAELKQILVAG